MKKDKPLFIKIFGIILLVIFTFVAAYNIVPRDDSSNSFFVKVDDNISGKIESIMIENNKLLIETSGDITHYCLKSTKSKPDVNAICFKEIINGKAEIPVMNYKTYYVWIKDNQNNISNYIEVNSK